MREEVIILGGGGHARVVAEVLRRMSRQILGYLAPQQSEEWELKWLGGDESIVNYSPDKYVLANGIGSVRDQVLRTSVFGQYKHLGFRFITLVHPGAIIASDVKLGEGCQIMAGAVLQPGVQCGDNVLVNTQAGLDHDCIISSNSHISIGAQLSGDVVVGFGSHIGAGSTIMQGIEIGSHSVVGAGAVVIRNVKDGAVVVGVPAKDISGGQFD